MCMCISFLSHVENLTNIGKYHVHFNKKSRFTGCEDSQESQQNGIYCLILSFLEHKNMESILQ